MRPKIRELCELVASHYGYITADEIASADRHKSVAEARAIAMWLARTKYGLSYPELGREFGRDHTTCISSFRRVERADGMLLETARALAANLDPSPRMQTQTRATGAREIDFGTAAE